MKPKKSFTMTQTTTLMTTFETDWLKPDWPQAGQVRALITSRQGGFSGGPFAGLNLSFGRDHEPSAERDRPSDVLRNRAQLRHVLPADPVWLNQVHGAQVRQLHRNSGAPAAHATAATGLPEADAVFTCDPGVVCAVMVADCLPILLCDAGGTVVAAVHAGWRGLAAGIIQKTVLAMRAATHPQTLDIQAYLGPAIGPDHFEVGAEVLAAMELTLPQAKLAFGPTGPNRFHANLWVLASQALNQVGVSRVFGGGLCTFSNPQRFYSYRRDKITGRMAALIWCDTA